MVNIFKPDLYLNSIFEIDLKLLFDKGITNMIIDIDNTLSKWGSAKPEPYVCQWLDYVKENGFRICILSNSSNKRIQNYCSELDVIFVKNVRKPLKSSFYKAMDLLGSDKNNTCVIGDQIFTDILGGNACGLFTILIDPIDNKEFFITKFTRNIEKIMIKRFLKK